MTVLMLLAMAAGTYLLRLVGLTLGGRQMPEVMSTILPAMPAALLAGLVVTNGLVRDGSLVIDARLGGLVVAALIAAKGWGLSAAVIGAVAATGSIRLIASALGG